MKPSTELFELIKSLTPSEKRYFKLNAALQKGNKNYIRLFEIIDSQKVYDEKEVKNKLKEKYSTENITFTKNYLYKLIFKNLLYIYNEKSLDAILGNILNRCRIMYDKALFPQYFKTVEYGKKLAKKNERFALLLKFLEMERQLTKKEDIGKKNINDIYDEEIAVLEKIANINKYKRAVAALFKIERTNGIVRNEFVNKKINEVVSKDEFKNEKSALSITALEKYYLVMNLACELKGNLKEAYDYNKKRFELIKTNKRIFEQFIFDNYGDAFSSLSISAVKSGKLSEAANLCRKFETEFFKYKTVNIDALTVYYLVNLMLAVSKPDAEIKDLTDSAEKFLLKYKGKITINNYNYIFFLLSYYFFTTKRFDESLRVLNTLFQNKTLKFTTYLEPYSRMLYLIANFETGNNKLFGHLLSSTLKYLKRNNGLFKTETLVINFLNKARRISDKKKLSENLKLLCNQLSVLKKDKYEKHSFHYIDYLTWAKGKVNRLNASSDLA